MDGKDIKAWRRKHGMSQELLGKILEVDRLTITRWEGGKQEPPPYLWRALRNVEVEIANGVVIGDGYDEGA